MAISRSVWFDGRTDRGRVGPAGSSSGSRLNLLRARATICWQLVIFRHLAAGTQRHRVCFTAWRSVGSAASSEAAAPAARTSSRSGIWTSDRRIDVRRVPTQLLPDWSGAPRRTCLYEARGLPSPARSAGGTRRYSGQDLTRLREIGRLLDDGLNLAGITGVLELRAANPATPRAARRGAPSDHKSASSQVTAQVSHSSKGGPWRDTDRVRFEASARLHISVTSAAFLAVR